MSFLNRIKEAAYVGAVRRGETPPAPPIDERARVLKEITNAEDREYAAGNCSGCADKGTRPLNENPKVVVNATFLGNLKDLGGKFRDLAKLVTGKKCTEEEYEARKTACETCPMKDSKDKPLFREFKEGWYSCGALRHENALRDSSVDGCGCVLNLKWASKPQTCPLKEPRW